MILPSCLLLIFPSPLVSNLKTTSFREHDLTSCLLFIFPSPLVSNLKTTSFREHDFTKLFNTYISLSLKPKLLISKSVCSKTYYKIPEKERCLQT